MLPSHRVDEDEPQSFQEEMKALIDKMGHLSKQVRQKSDEEKCLYKAEVKKMQGLLTCTQNREDTISANETERLKASMQQMQAEIEEKAKKEESLRQRVKQAEEELSQLRKQLGEKMQQSDAQPKSRFSVNLYRDVSKIRWCVTDSSPREVKGFISNKSGAGTKTFKFDEEKQSPFFISNSLWSMSDSQ